MQVIDFAALPALGCGSWVRPNTVHFTRIRGWFRGTGQGGKAVIREQMEGLVASKPGAEFELVIVFHFRCLKKTAQICAVFQAAGI